MNLEIKKDLASNWFKTLQDAFCDDISKLEKNKVVFKSTVWKRNTKKDEGGGEFRILKNGKIFDKVGVNFSKVYGKFPKQFQKKIPWAQKDPRFWASGISVVMHFHYFTYFFKTTLLNISQLYNYTLFFWELIDYFRDPLVCINIL